MRGEARVSQVLGGAESVWLSVIVMGELLDGFRNGTREQENRDVLAEFLQQGTVRVTPVTQETSEVYSEIRQQLRRDGSPIPTNDIWIAAQAVELGAVLITSDQHYRRVAGLRIHPAGWLS